MGAAVSAARKQLDQSDEQREAMEQRLNILETKWIFSRSPVKGTKFI